MARKAITVRQLNEYIARLIEDDPLLYYVKVSGEVVSAQYHFRGHLYMTLGESDGSSKISVVFFNFKDSDIPEVKSGDKVVIEGRISLYVKSGNYQIIGRTLMPEGEGQMAILFKKLKKALEEKGFFDPRHKKPIPIYTRKIGVVTSKTGAAITDIKKVIESRNPMVKVYLFPAQVQGDGAELTIKSAIELANEKYPDLDLLIVGRGGGATEDLYAFNAEVVAEAIFKSKIPIISAVGHERDVSISDFVADARAATPTEAATMATRSLIDIEKELKDKILGMGSFLERLLQERLSEGRRSLEEIRLSHLDRIKSLEKALEENYLILRENNPLEVLSKGYAIITGEDGSLVDSHEKIGEKNSYYITLRDGKEKYRLVRERS